MNTPDTNPHTFTQKDSRYNPVERIPGVTHEEMERRLDTLEQGIDQRFSYMDQCIVRVDRDLSGLAKNYDRIMLWMLFVGMLALFFKE